MATRVPVPAAVWRVEALLGEGPVWVAREQALYFVDIEAGRIHRWNPANESGETVQVGGAPSFIVPAAGGELLVGSGHQIRFFSDGRLRDSVATISQPASNRTNDATVDPEGRLWFGTMDTAQAVPTGAIWCLEKGVARCIGGEAVITNGPAIDYERRILYYVDTLERAIRRCALDAREPRPAVGTLVQLDAQIGYPDGIAVDAEGCVWVGLWDGWGVRRYAPDGSLLMHVAFPCARVTKVAFGGRDLRTIYATTARGGLDRQQLERQPLAGSLFRFDAPTAGRSVPEVQLS